MSGIPRALSVPVTPATPSTPGAVGEIDTKAPFESVKAAVTLFVEASPKTDTCRPVLKKSRTMESVLGKETQLHWLLKEIDKCKEQVKTAESTKGQALAELEKANKALQEVTVKIEASSKSKQASTQATEAAKTRANQLEQLKSTKSQKAWQEEVDNERNQYKDIANELISTKQQLTNLKHDFDIALEAKMASFQRAAEAQHSAKLNRKKISQLSKDLDGMSQTLERLKLASAKAEEDHVKLTEEKLALLDSKKKAKQDVDLKIESLRKEAQEDPKKLVKRLEETTEAVNVLREQSKEVRAADMEMLRSSNAELDEAKRRLEKLKEKENSLRDVRESLKKELENVSRDISSIKEDEVKGERLQAELDQVKLQVEEAKTKKTIVTNDVQELESKISGMVSEAEKARQEEDEIRKQVEIYWREAQLSELAIKQAETKLEIAQREVEEAEAAKEFADDQIRNRTSSSSSCCSSTNSFKKKECSVEEEDLKCDNSSIVLTTKDYEGLSKKAEEATVMADTKVEAIMEQLETIKQKERGVLEKLEKSMQENKEIQEEIIKAQKMGEVADAEKQRIEIELNNWRQKEAKR
ncbi:WEB family protein At5g55860-like [Rutidosis leptorrhynchoides]|uniref:WEB family protein At5g55860-like n=1 Tax=Rutidosis leptorrhynchoides TaxID=125765 RepID=UPI003A998AAA